MSIKVAKSNESKWQKPPTSISSSTAKEEEAKDAKAYNQKYL